MINCIMLIICGSVSVKVPREYAEQALNFLVFNKIRFFSQSVGDDGALTFTLFFPHLKSFAAFCKKNGCAFELSEVRGLPRLYQKYGKRWGVYAGIVLFALIVWQSTKYVWCIDVTGNKSVPSSEIISNLEQLGFTYGSAFGRTDFDVLHNKYLATFNDLCWISVNMEGTHAHVEVRELVDYADEEEKSIKNVVAAESGRVVLIEAFEGKPMVRVGDKVAPGDILLSGIISVRDETVRYECSGGVVLAEVSRDFTVSVPKFEEKKEYTGEKEVRNELIFFKNHIKLLGNYGISYASYDTIEETKQICLFDDILLPVFIKRESAVEYVLQREALDGAAFEAKEKKMLSDALSEALAGGELLEINTEREELDDSVVLHCNIKCLADIAKPVTLGSVTE